MKRFLSSLCLLATIFTLSLNGCEQSITEPDNIAFVTDSARIVKALTAHSWRLHKLDDQDSRIGPIILDGKRTTIKRYRIDGNAIEQRFDSNHQLEGTYEYLWRLTRNLESGSIRWVVRHLTLAPNGTVVSDYPQFLTDLSSTSLVLSIQGNHGLMSEFFKPH
jgi:hypothetical protein